MTAKNYTQITGKSEEVANYLHKNDTALLADSMSGDFECWYSILVNDDGLVEHPTGADDEAKFDYHADYLEDLLDDLEDEYADKDAQGRLGATINLILRRLTILTSAKRLRI